MTLLMIDGKRVVRIGVGIALAVLAGSAAVRRESPARAGTTAPKPKTIAAAVKTPAAASATSGLGISGQGSYVALPDPKRPGKYLWKLWAKEFVVETPSSAVSGTLYGVSALLFNKGKAAATLAAPKAQGNNVKNIMEASGGVLVKSLEEKGTQVRADRVTWYAKDNQIIASGHVHYVNGKSGMTISTPCLIGDTVLRSVRSSDPGRIVVPSGTGSKRR